MKIRFLLLMSLMSMNAPSLEATPPSLQQVEHNATLRFLDPSLQKVEWRKGVLPNGMRVLLVHDPDVDKSAAALSVRAGSMENPVEMPGIAHFLEHMVSRGNEKYPDEAGWREYLTEKGGRYNAYTSMDHTTYMFEINHAGYEEALDRFAHFFIDPVFHEGCTDREKNAVHQEYMAKIPFDGRKQWRLSQHLMDPAHPYSKFSTGNLETLGEATTEDVRHFFDTYYSSNLMTLVLVSPLPPSQMEPLLEPFVAVANKENEERPIYGTMFPKKGILVYQEPSSPTRKLQLIWELPGEVLANRDTKVEQLLSHVFGDESAGSLTSLLKEEGYITSLSASAENQGGQAIQFSLNLSLTEEGLGRSQTVIKRVFQAITAIREQGIPQELMEDVNELSRIAYGFQTREDGFSRAKGHAAALIRQGLSHYPDEDILISHFDKERLQRALDHLTPQHCLFWLMAPSDEALIKPEAYEPIRQVHYAVQEIDEDLLDEWATVKPHEKIRVTSKNPWIPSKFDSVHTIEANGPRIPQTLANSAGRHWIFLPDDLFGTPKVHAEFYIQSPLIVPEDPKSQVMATLLVCCLDDTAAELLYPAGVAGLRCSFRRNHEALILRLEGFDEKAYDLIDQLVRHDHGDLRPLFKRHLDRIKSDYAKRDKGWAARQALRAMDAASRPGYRNFDALLAAAEELTWEEFEEFCAEWKENCFLKGVVGGNLSKGQAVALSSRAFSPCLNGTGSEELRRRPLGFVTPSEEPKTVRQTMQVPGVAPILQLTHGKVEYSAEGYRARAAHRILGKLLADSFFQTLRSEQGACYVAWAGCREIEKHLVTRLVVQSTTVGADELLERYEAYLADQVEKSREGTEMRQKFEKVRTALIEELEQPYRNFIEALDEVEYLTFEREKEYPFKERLVAALKELTWDEFQQHLEEGLSKEHNPRRFAILMEGEAADAEE